MKRLRARVLQGDEPMTGSWFLFASRANPIDLYRRIDFPIVLEFVDTETGEVTPLELEVEG